MSDDSDALKRIDQKLQKMTQMMRGIRKQSAITVMGLPLYHIALGPDLDAGQKRGHAKGIIAIGDIATGVLAIGGCALGLLALGGAAIGGLAVGGAALGIVAIGGGAAGYYACGGGAIGAHVLSGMRQDPEMLELVKRLLPGTTIPTK
jgi:hypothetical protein